MSPLHYINIFLYVAANESCHNTIRYLYTVHTSCGHDDLLAICLNAIHLQTKYNISKAVWLLTHRFRVTCLPAIYQCSERNALSVCSVINDGIRHVDNTESANRERISGSATQITYTLAQGSICRSGRCGRFHCNYFTKEIIFEFLNRVSLADANRRKILVFGNYEIYAQGRGDSWNPAKHCQIGQHSAFLSSDTC